VSEGAGTWFQLHCVDPKVSTLFAAFCGRIEARTNHGVASCGRGIEILPEVLPQSLVVNPVIELPVSHWMAKQMV
jgi:hypothetical protein